MIGIYKITSPSGKVYIGESKDIDRRWNDYRTLNCKTQIKLYNSFLKHGVENHTFEVLMECNINELHYFERTFQDLYNVIGKNGLNCILRGTNDKKYEDGIETRNKKSQSAKIKFSNPENRKKQSISQKKLYDSGYKHPNIGTKQSESTIKKRIEKTKGLKRSEETKKKIGEANSIALKKLYENGYINPLKGRKTGKLSLNAKQVINNQNGFIYDSALRAYEASGLKINYSSFARKLSGERKNDTNFEYC